MCAKSGGSGDRYPIGEARKPIVAYGTLTSVETEIVRHAAQQSAGLLSGEIIVEVNLEGSFAPVPTPPFRFRMNDDAQERLSAG